MFVDHPKLGEYDLSSLTGIAYGASVISDAVLSRAMLIAFNAAPGTVAPAEQGPYGIYAQSLAEMIRTGGLPLPEVFNRVRLRVNEASKGAQVPWDSQKVDAAFMILWLFLQR